MPEDTIVSDPESEIQDGGEQDSAALESIIDGGGIENTSEGAVKEGAEKKILGRFGSEEEAAKYLSDLESKVQKKESEESFAELSSIRREEAGATTEEVIGTAPKPKVKSSVKLPEIFDEETAATMDTYIASVVESRMAPIKAEMQRKQDFDDFQIIQKIPGYKQYVPLAKEFISRNPNSKLIEAFRAVVDPQEFASAFKKKPNRDEITILKRHARGERSGDSAEVIEGDGVKNLENKIFPKAKQDESAKRYFGIIG
jgi:hypothetical protein